VNTYFNKACAGALLVLIVISAQMANSAPSKGKVMTACKDKIYEVLSAVSRLKFRKYQRSGLTFTLKTGDGRQAIRCVFEDGKAVLFQNDELIRN